MQRPKRRPVQARSQLTPVMSDQLSPAWQPQDLQHPRQTRDTVHLSAFNAIEMASSGAAPRKTATASPTILRIWCSMKDCPTTLKRTQGWPCTAAAEQALIAEMRCWRARLLSPMQCKATKPLPFHECRRAHQSTGDGEQHVWVPRRKASVAWLTPLCTM